MSELAELQRHFYAVATGTAPVHHAAGMVDEPGRLAIYCRMYGDRLADVLAQELPKLASALGAEWRPRIAAYLRACPPAHHDIREAGRRLAGFLTGWEADLARLEWARSDVFFGADATPLALEELAALDPVALPALGLALVPASQIVPLAYDVDELWSAIEDGVDLPPVAPRTRSVLVWRRELMTVVHRTLDSDEAACIDLLARGARFADVCELLAAVPDPPARALELLIRWAEAGALVSSRL